jgi:site-specific DNA-methyltransferase (adenine-specific)
MADKTIDVVITDPPYEAEAHTKARRTLKGDWAKVNDYGKVFESYEIDFVPITEEQRVEAAKQIVRVTRGWALVFCQVEAVALWRAALEAAGANWRRAMAWVKPDGTPQLTGDRPAQGFECIATAWCSAGRSQWNGGGRRGVFTHCVNNYGRNDRPHPTSKPLSLMSELVSLFSDPGEVILDPFAGSGSTLLAARDLGRSSIGWELNRSYFDIACRRFRGERAKPLDHQPELFK